MWIVLVGIAIVAIPIALAARTIVRIARRLGSVDANAVAKWIEGKSEEEIAALARDLRKEAPSSLAARLLDAATSGEAKTPIAKQLALAEAVSELERDVVDDIRVPRVAASLATTGGLLAAAVVMRQGLGAVYEGESGAEVTAHFQTIIERGLTLAAIAVLGGVVCAALHRNAQKQRKLRLEEVDTLVAPLATRLGIERP